MNLYCIIFLGSIRFRSRRGINVPYNINRPMPRNICTRIYRLFEKFSKFILIISEFKLSTLKLNLPFKVWRSGKCVLYSFLHINNYCGAV